MAIPIGAFTAKLKGWIVEDAGDKPDFLDSKDVILKPNSGRMTQVRFEDAVEAFYSTTPENSGELRDLRNQFNLGVNDAERWDAWRTTAKTYRSVFANLAADLANVDTELSRKVSKYSHRAQNESQEPQTEVEQFRIYVKLIRAEFSQRLDGGPCGNS